MSLIIEGPDSVGKSTAAKTAAEILDWPIEHWSRPAPGFDHCEGYVRALVPRRVYDRFHLGSIVYGELCGFYNPRMSPIKLRFMLQYVMRRAFVVIMHVDHRMISGMLETQGKDHSYNHNQIIKAAYMYDYLISIGSYLGTCLYHVDWDIGMLGYPSVEVVGSWARDAENKSEIAEHDTAPVWPW